MMNYWYSTKEFLTDGSVAVIKRTKWEIKKKSTGSKKRKSEFWYFLLLMTQVFHGAAKETKFESSCIWCRAGPVQKPQLQCHDNLYRQFWCLEINVTFILEEN